MNSDLSQAGGEPAPRPPERPSACHLSSCCPRCPGLQAVNPGPLGRKLPVHVKEALDKEECGAARTRVPLPRPRPGPPVQLRRAADGPPPRPLPTSPQADVPPWTKEPDFLCSARTHSGDQSAGNRARSHQGFLPSSLRGAAGGSPQPQRGVLHDEAGGPTVCLALAQV